MKRAKKLGCRVIACPNVTAYCEYHAPMTCDRPHKECEREHHPKDIEAARELVNAVLRSEDVLTDRKWLKLAKRFVEGR